MPLPTRGPSDIPGDDVQLVLILFLVCKGIARTQSPTTINAAPESPTFGVIARVSPTEVQWKGLALGERP